MSPRTIGDLVHRDAPVIAENATVQAALPVLLFSRLPALPVVNDKEQFVGIFGEREFITALFPGYVGSLKHAGFVPKSIDAALQKRQSCRTEPVSKHMNTEDIDVGPDFSDVGLAEIFIHHRVLIVPVVENKRVVGVITRADFFAAVAERFLGDPA
jgi:CBS-domain-containing membrane protein